MRESRGDHGLDWHKVTMSRFKRPFFGALLATTCYVATVFVSPLYHTRPPQDPPDVLNDVARLNPTTVREVIHPTSEEEIRSAVSRAVANGVKVTIAGKRHSMGGQRFIPMQSPSTC